MLPLLNFNCHYYLLLSLFNYHPSFWKVNYTRNPNSQTDSSTVKLSEKFPARKFKKLQHHNGRTLSKHFFSHCVMCKSAISDGEPKNHRIRVFFLHFLPKFCRFLMIFHLIDWANQNFLTFLIIKIFPFFFT